MADKKISELDAITGADTAADDFFIVVDSSGSTTKKISRAELNNAIERDVLDTVDINGGTIDGTTIGASSAAAITGTTITGTSFASTGNMTFGDNNKAIFGAGSDLQIYHSGVNSFISDAGAGDLFIQAQDLTLRGADASTRYLTGVQSTGAVTAFYGNAAKLATTATGVDISSTDATVNFVSSRGTGATHTITTGGANSGNFNISAAAGGDIYVNAENKIFRNAAGSSEHMRIDSSGNVGIGTTSPNNQLEIKSDTATVVARLACNTGSGRDYGVASNTTGAFGIFDYDANSYRFYITSSGNVLVGTTSVIRNANDLGVSVEPEGRIYLGRGAASGGFSHLVFINSNGAVGSVVTSGSATSYNTSSDYRLKENVTADWDATTRLKQLNPVRFNFIADPDTTVDGFLAHEVQDIVPEAISGTKDEVDDDGNPVYQGIDQSKLIPLLVKTIQELEARIAALEAK